jgi:hypothetical protein
MLLNIWCGGMAPDICGSKKWAYNQQDTKWETVYIASFIIRLISLNINDCWSLKEAVHMKVMFTDIIKKREMLGISVLFEYILFWNASRNALNS